MLLLLRGVEDCQLFHIPFKLFLQDCDLVQQEFLLRRFYPHILLNESSLRLLLKVLQIFYRLLKCFFRLLRSIKLFCNGIQF